MPIKKVTQELVQAGWQSFWTLFDKYSALDICLPRHYSTFNFSTDDFFYEQLLRPQKVVSREMECWVMSHAVVSYIQCLIRIIMG